MDNMTIWNFNCKHKYDNFICRIQIWIWKKKKVGFGSGPNIQIKNLSKIENFFKKEKSSEIYQIGSESGSTSTGSATLVLQLGAWCRILLDTGLFIVFSHSIFARPLWLKRYIYIYLNIFMFNIKIWKRSSFCRNLVLKPLFHWGK